MSDQQQRDPVEEARWQLARRFRDWVHESPLSRCNASVDECPDWPLAYELADVALGAGLLSSPPDENDEGNETFGPRGAAPQGSDVDALRAALASIWLESPPRMRTPAFAPESMARIHSLASGALSVAVVPPPPEPKSAAPPGAKPPSQEAVAGSPSGEEPLTAEEAAALCKYLNLPGGIPSWEQDVFDSAVAKLREMRKGAKLRAALAGQDDE